MNLKNTFKNAVAKAFGLTQLAAQWKAGEPLGQNNAARPGQPYAQIDVVFSCVEKLVTAISGLPLVLSTAGEDIVESGPAYDLLFNSSLTCQDLITQTVGHYALTRDVFWIFTDMAGLTPKEIVVVSGSQMRAVTSDGTMYGPLVGWEFIGLNGSRLQLGLSDVYHIKNFNPYDPYHGLGPLSAGAMAMSQSYQASLFNESALANGAELGPILFLDGKPDPEIVGMLRSQFDYRHKGAAQAGRAVIAAGIKDIKTIAQNMVDIQLVELKNMSDQRICSVMGVPPGVVGLITEAQYAQGPAQRDFYTNSVCPLCVMIASHITDGILKRFYASTMRAVPAAVSKTFGGRLSRLTRRQCYVAARQKAIQSQRSLFAWFDSDVHPVMQEMQRETAEKVLKFKDAGVPLNALIEAHNLPYESVPWGDDWWISAGLMPARYVLEGGEGALLNPSLPEGGDPAPDDQATDEPLPGDEPTAPKSVKSAAEKSDAAQRLRLWHNWVLSWAGIEREYNQALRSYFMRQQKAVITSLKSEFSNFKSLKADRSEVIARVVFSLKQDNAKLRMINQVFFAKASELGLRQTLTEIAELAGEKLTEAVDAAKGSVAIRQALIVQSQKISAINEVTQKRLAKTLLDGLNSGEGLPELSKRVADQLGSNRARSLSIARTQTAGAVSAGRHEGFKAAGVELKAWITSGDEHVRKTHIEAGRQYKNGIPLEEAFWVGGDAMLHPGDPGASPANTINCRCVEVAIRAKGKDFSIDHWSNYKFYSYDDLKSVESVAKES